MAVASLYMAEAGLLAGLELVVRLVLVLVHVLQEVQSQGQQGWMRKIGVDHNNVPVWNLQVAPLGHRYHAHAPMVHICGFST